MTRTSVPNTEHRLDRLYADLEQAHIQPLWTITQELLTSTPRPAAVPWLWPASTMKPLARDAIALVPVERGGERRALSLRNPGLGGRPYAVGTLWGALQCLGPNEVAPAHRHSPGAVRFVLEGEGVWTTVDGDACDMRPGDLVLTPSMNWHDHTSTTQDAMLWFDGLDLPMIEALDGVFFEPYPGPGASQPEPAEHNVSERGYAIGQRYRVGSAQAVNPAPSKLLTYRWTETEAELDRLAAASDEPLLQLEYVDPETGASVLPTLACAVHRIRAGRRSAPVRRSGNAIYVVFRGSGWSIIDGQRFDWTDGDMFVVPSWAPVEHAAEQDADLFVLSDEPVMRALGIARTEALSGPQQVASTFDPRQPRGEVL